MEILTERAQAFRQAITAFIDGRRDAKLKGDDNDGDIAAKYEYGIWLADAARRVNQIQAVTHVLKATHPDARGSSLHLAPTNLPQHREIGSHLLGDTFAEDIVGNAAALDVYKLLKLEHDGQTPLDLLLAADADAIAALHTDDKHRSLPRCYVRARQPGLPHPYGKPSHWLASSFTAT